MCGNKGLFAVCACAFGVGVLLTSFLPAGVLVCVQGVLILGTGVLLFGRG